MNINDPVQYSHQGYVERAVNKHINTYPTLSTRVSLMHEHIPIFFCLAPKTTTIPLY
jgi:hypothetical protein